MTHQMRALIGLTGLLSTGQGFAQMVEEFEAVTVLARRITSTSEEHVSRITAIRGEELARQQRHLLLESLNLNPGTQGLSTAGLTGNTGTVIIRGLPSSYQQIVVDGVKIADVANPVGSFLGSANLGQIDRLEVLRGPQSVLFGTGAGGGVLGYETAVGEGAPSFKFFGEGGSFESFRSGLSSQGKIGNFSYGAELGYQVTANDTYAALPIHDFEQGYANLALEWEVGDDLRLKFSYRGTDNFLRTRSITEFGTSDSEVHTETSIFALNAFYQVNPAWQSRFTLGYYQENFAGDFLSAFGSSRFGIDYERFTFNWSHELEVSDSLSAVAGVELGKSDFSNTSGQATEQENYGAYAKLYYRLSERLSLEAGGRYDEHDEFGGDRAWSLGAIYTIEQSDTRLHARLSEAFRNPTRLDSEFFQSLFSTQEANPDLQSETIRAYEIGVTQAFGNHKAELTYYHQEVTNAVVTESLGLGRTRRINSPGESSLSGLELAASGHFLNERLRYRLAFTAQFDEEVIDLPDYFGSLDVSYDGGSYLLGIGVSYADGAAYLPAGNPQTDDRLVTRIYGEYQLTESVRFHARIENLFDENYELFSNAFGQGSEIIGPGRAFSLGATVTW